MYSELHTKTNFSFLQGASHPDELVRCAAELGYHSLAITDRNSLAGVVRAHTAAKEVGLKLIIGAEVTPTDGPTLVLWVTNRASYGRLSRLITVGRRRAPKGECELTMEDVAEHAEGLIIGVVPEEKRGRRQKAEGRRREVENGEDGRANGNREQQERPGTHSSVNTDRPNSAASTPHSAPHLRRFPSPPSAFCLLPSASLHLLVELHRGATDDQYLSQLIALSQQTGLPLLAAGDVHYHVPQRMVLYDVVTAIRQGTTVDQVGQHRFANAQRHLRSLQEIREIYARIPAAVERTRHVADQCQFSLDELRYEYPEELAPRGLTPFAYLRELTWRGARRRYPGGIPDKVKELVRHELQLIEELHYEAYFLTVWDIVRFARQRGILCQGRGSAANSAACYCLGITAVDPDHMDVLFERFVSRERNEAPDIDVDFEHERREEVIQYLYKKYGRQRAGLAAEVITYRVRSAIRDAGKALGLSLDRVDALAKQVEGYHRESNLADRCRQVGIDPESETGRRVVYCVENLIGFPRHLSQHVGGMVMTQGLLCELVPIENAAMADRTVISWDKNDLDDLGILKVDCLALGMLTAIRKCFDLIRQHTGRHLTLANIPPDDPQVYDMICRADTMGVFQVESRAQMSMLPRLRPRCYYDLVIEVAIVRPGPIQGQMVHPYLRRRAGQEQVSYANEEIRAVLHKTLGVPIFQEQAMRLAVVAAGFTPGEADQLRRAMGAWRRPGIIDNFRTKLIDGMLQRGLTHQFAEQVFNQIRGFGEYGFPESHAASFALLVYVSAWLKHYYPAAFAAALINSQPMGFYAPAQLIRDARDHGVEVRPVDVNASQWDCLLEEERQKGEEGAPGKALVLRLGMRLIVGFSERFAQVVCEVRKGGEFRSYEDFAKRTRLSRAVVTQLAQADALASLGRDRRQSLWEALAQENQPRDLPLFEQIEPEDEAPVTLPEMEPMENVFADYETTGLSLRAHPVSFFRERLDNLGVVPAKRLADLQNNRHVCVAGLVLLRQRPSTAKGITFVTLEDETGTANLVVHQKTWERFYAVARRSPAWVAFGKLESKYSVIHVVTNRIVDFAEFTDVECDRLHAKSRDFR